MDFDTEPVENNTLHPLLKNIPLSKLPPTEKIWPWLSSTIPTSSDNLHISPIPYTQNIRAFSLQATKTNNASFPLPPPVISASEFIPPSLTEHLMRKKRGSALGAKFVPDAEITNMEGVMHTFVVPVVPRCEMVGDYCFSVGHRVTPPVLRVVSEGEAGKGRRGGEGEGEGKKGEKEKVVMTRSVVLSAAIHMDFEFSNVMMEVCRLRGEVVEGKDLLNASNDGNVEWKIPSKEEKQDEEMREKYDEALRRHLIYHLVPERRLPALGEEGIVVMSLEKALRFLSELILNASPDEIQSQLKNQHVKIHSRTLSLSLLFATAFHLVRNEFSALEAICSTQGYVYTYDPASIFAGAVGAELLNRVWILGLKYLASHNQLTRLKILGFNDYADRSALKLVRAALESQEHVVVVSKGELFRGEDGRFERGRWIEGKGDGRGDGGRYDVGKWERAGGAMLVVHNNSDAFGQNVETEGMGGSLDGAIGASSSAAGSLERRRSDLLDWVI